MPYDVERDLDLKRLGGKGNSPTFFPGNIQLSVGIIEILLLIITGLMKRRPLHIIMGKIRESKKYSDELLGKVEKLIKESENWH